MIHLRTIRLVAGFDLYESLRSRKAIALICLYTIAALAGAALFVKVFNTMMLELADQFGQEATTKMLESDQLVDLIAEKLVHNDKTVARELLSVPPLALFYGWWASNLLPLVVVLTSTDAISEPVATGGIRYALFRAGRLDWALGKFAGQTLLMAVGIAVGGLATFILGATSLNTFEASSTLWWIFIMCGRSLFYGFAYLGVAMCASQLVRSNAAARALGIAMMFVLVVGGVIVQAPGLVARAPDLLGAVKYIFPNAHALTLFHPSLMTRLPSMLALMLIGAAYFALGFLRFSERDT